MALTMELRCGSVERGLETITLQYDGDTLVVVNMENTQLFKEIVVRAVASDFKVSPTLMGVLLELNAHHGETLSDELNEAISREKAKVLSIVRVMSKKFENNTSLELSTQQAPAHLLVELPTQHIVYCTAYIT